MIIRRIAKGIKEQDWFVVSIEVLIVVVGIFFGMHCCIHFCGINSKCPGDYQRQTYT